MTDASDDFVAPSGDAPSAAAASRSREHDLKCWPEFFKHLWSGEKTFEIRKDDRGYQAGDTLTLREWTERHGYSGRWIKYDVPFLLGGIWPGLGPEHVCMSIKEIERSRLPPAAAREDVEPWEGAPAKVPVWVRDVRLVLRDLQALHENVEEGRDIPQHIYKGASAALRALDHQFLMGEIPPNPEELVAKHQSAVDAILYDPRRMAREITSDIMATEDEIADAIAGAIKHATSSLSLRVKELEEALKPFAKLSDQIAAWESDTNECWADDERLFEAPHSETLKLADIRRARTVLHGEGDE
jgi:hypothetical protein